MANDKVYLVVMVACMDSPLAIQNTMEVPEVLAVYVGLNCLLLDLMAD
jgi:hypothetical protein